MKDFGKQKLPSRDESIDLDREKLEQEKKKLDLERHAHEMEKKTFNSQLQFEKDLIEARMQDELERREAIAMVERKDREKNR